MHGFHQKLAHHEDPNTVTLIDNPALGGWYATEARAFFPSVGRGSGWDSCARYVVLHMQYAGEAFLSPVLTSCTACESTIPSDQLISLIARTPEYI
jgi:hypothetical protein